MTPAIVVITTINFDSLPQPQDSLFPAPQQLTRQPFPGNIGLPDAAYNL
jgi:hypothetical protein